MSRSKGVAYGHMTGTKQTCSSSVARCDLGVSRASCCQKSTEKPSRKMPKAKKSGRKKKFNYEQDRKKLKKKLMKKCNPRIEK